MFFFFLLEFLEDDTSMKHETMFSVHSRVRFVRNHALMFKITHSEKSSAFFFHELIFQNHAQYLRQCVFLF